jgi:hypothetical protein
MSIFDNDLIKKDPPLEDLIKMKITDRVESVTAAINARSRNGIENFDRLSARGSYGAFDNNSSWGNRYDAFVDYLSVSLQVLQNELKHTPPFYNKGRVYIERTRVLQFQTEFFSDNIIGVRVLVCYYTLQQRASRILPPIRNDFERSFDYKVSLELPTCHPLKDSLFRFPII